MPPSLGNRPLLWLLRITSTKALEAQSLCRLVACDYPADLLHFTPQSVFSRALSYTIWNGHIRYWSEKEFSDRRLRSMTMRFCSWPVRIGFRRNLLLRSGRFGLLAFCLVHTRLAAFCHLLQLFDLLRGQLGQATDEGDERPDGFRTVFPLERRRSSKARHVRDDVEKLAVGQLLRIRLGAA